MNAATETAPALLPSQVFALTGVPGCVDGFKRVSAAAAAKRGALEVQEREHGLYYRLQDKKEAK